MREAVGREESPDGGDGGPAGTRITPRENRTVDVGLIEDVGESTTSEDVAFLDNGERR